MSERMTRDNIGRALYDIRAWQYQYTRWVSERPDVAEDALARRKAAEQAIRDEYDALTADVARLTADVERMRPVFEAAMRYCRIDGGYDAAACHKADVAHYDLCSAAKAAMKEQAQ